MPVKKPFLNPNRKRKSSKVYVRESYRNLYTNMSIPITDLFIERLAADLVTWSKDDPEALKLGQFYMEKGIDRETFDRWCKTYPILEKAKIAAKENIGNRREIGAIKNKYNYNMISRMQHRYDPEWWEAEVQRANLKASMERKAAANIKYTVVVDDFSKTQVSKNKPEGEEDEL